MMFRARTLPTVRRVSILAAFGLVVGCGAAGCKSPEVSGRAAAEGRSDGAFLWRGFDHRWTYNHRLNRMGDYLEHDECSTGGPGDLLQITCTGSLHHTGASGTGADQLKFTSHYTEVGSVDADFRPVHVQLHFQGREQREIRREQTVEVPVDADRDSDSKFVALLNGYDLRVTGRRRKAKKVKRFRVWVTDEPTLDADEGTVSFGVGGVLDVNCDSVECKTQRNRVHYRLDVRALLISADRLVGTARRFETAYSWNKRTELRSEQIPLNRRRQHIRGRPRAFEVGLLGFREIDFDLGKKGKYKDHWFVRWENSIRNTVYRRPSGKASFDLTLLFKEWNAKTKRKAVSMARAGEATLTGEVVLVQITSGRVDRSRTSGSLKWRGRNRSPDDSAAEWWTKLRFEF